MNSSRLLFNLTGKIVSIGKHSISKNWENLYVKIHIDNSDYDVEINVNRNHSKNIINDFLFKYTVNDCISFKAFYAQAKNKSLKLKMKSINS